MEKDLKTKIQEAITDMMTKVKFIDDEKQHRYETLDGKWLQGVSTVSSIVPKDWLSAWGAKEAVKYLGFSDYEEDVNRAAEMFGQIVGLYQGYQLELEDAMRGGNIKADSAEYEATNKRCLAKALKHYTAILKEAKGAAFRKGAEALVDGTAGHTWLESYVLAKIRGTDLPDIPKVGLLERPIQQFLDWEKDNVDYWILAEARIAYPEKGYAGTLDAVAMLKGEKLALIDFKFASRISEDYFLQAAGYAAAFEPYGIKFDERIILRLPKTLELDVWDKKTHTYSKVANTIESHVVKTDYELDRDVFFGCLPLKQWINSVTKNG